MNSNIPNLLLPSKLMKEEQELHSRSKPPQSAKVSKGPSGPKQAKVMTRTLKACDACRKLKSRCYKSSAFVVCCSRCLNLGQPCSLENDFKMKYPNIPMVNGMPLNVNTSTKMDHIGTINSDSTNGLDASRLNEELLNKINFIYLGVSELLSVVKTEGTSSLRSDMKQFLETTSIMRKEPISESPSFFSKNEDDLLENTNVTVSVGDSEKVFESPHVIEPDQEADPATLCLASKLFQISPFCIVSRLISHVPKPIMNLLNLSNIQKSMYKEDDIIDADILSSSKVVELMKEFRSNYGRWVLFPLLMFTDELIRKLREKSPFLLTTCCAISLRYLLNSISKFSQTKGIEEMLIYGNVLNHMAKDIQKAILDNTINNEDLGSDIEFLQAMVILSIYLFSISNIACVIIGSDKADNLKELQSLKLDPWKLSGLALTKFISNSCFGTLLEKDLNTDAPAAPYPSFDANETQKISIFRTYNHLILVHLVSCILSGRMCIVDEIRLKHCNLSLGLHSATNFDGRMVSEISILIITYNYIQINLNRNGIRTLPEVDESLLEVKQEIANWYEQWEYLFRQPALQFVEFCYNFCSIQIYLCYLHTKTLIATKLVSRQSPDFTNFARIDIIHILFNYCNDKILSMILSHAYHLVHFVTLVEDDLYFAYLSDQIFFSFYFGAIVLIKTTKHALDHKKLHCLNGIDDPSINQDNWEPVLTPVQLLIEKFDRVAENNPFDIITNYRMGISGCLDEIFPGIFN